MSIALAECASAPAVPLSLMQGAECIAGVLRTAPGATDIHIKVSADRRLAYPVIEYNSIDPRGYRQATDIRLFEVSGLEGEKYLFDSPGAEGDPIASNLLAEFETKCKAGVGSFHNDPG
jgi:hypothetical protein